MFIKKNNLTNGEIRIVNIPTSDFKEVIVDKNNLIIKTEKKNYSFGFNNYEDAQKAQENIFITLGLKSPFNNILDLSVLETKTKLEEEYVTFDEIAEKFKIDPRKLFISKSYTLDTEKDMEIE